MGVTTVEASASRRASSSFYRPELDAVRFLAFLFVFIYHSLPKDPNVYRGFPRELASIAASSAAAAGLGLQLFFTLSAYLICELLLREKARTGSVSMARFYKRRALRIWPLYFLGIIIGLIWAVAMGKLHQQAPWYIAFVFMVGNIYVGLHGWGLAATPASQLWSISVEEQFYVFWPAIAKICSEKLLYVAAWGIIAIANIALIYFGLRHTMASPVVWTNSFVQFYMFGAGILLSLFLGGRAPALSGIKRFSLFCASLLCFFSAAHWCGVSSPSPCNTAQLMIGYALVAFGCVGILVSGLGLQGVPRWAIYLGRISYGLYVFHELGLQSTFLFVERFHIPHPSLAIIPALCITIGLAMLSYRYFETPFLKMKDRAAVIHSQPPGSV